MIAKGTPHANGAVLARYLVTGKDHERAELWELRGFAAAGIVDAFRSVHVMARGTKCQAPFFHVYVRNPEGETLDRDQWEYTANSIERILGLTDQPRAIAFHIAEEGGHAHMHVAWSRIDADNLIAKPLPFYKRRLKTISRELEERFGLTLVPNRRESSIKYAPTRPEEEQARRLGFDIHETREIIRNCFERSNCGRGFQSALANAEMTLARGDRRDFLVVDRAGGVHGLGKRILDVSASEIRARFADLSRDNLPTVDQARASMIQTPRGATDMEQSGWQSTGSNMLAPAFRNTEISDVSDSDPVRHIDPDRCASNVSEGQQEEDAGSVGADPISEPAPSVEPGTSRPPLHGETPKGQLPPRTEAKSPGMTGSIRNLYRAVVKAITRSGPAPQPQKARRKDETAKGFKAAASALFRRVAGFPVLQDFYQSWNAFTWLKIWEYDNPDGMDCHQDTVKSPRAQNSRRTPERRRIRGIGQMAFFGA